MPMGTINIFSLTSFLDKLYLLLPTVKNVTILEMSIRYLSNVCYCITTRVEPENLTAVYTQMTFLVENILWMISC